MSCFHSAGEARAFFEQDQYARLSGITLDEWAEDTCLCSLTLTGLHRNAYGGVMGGAIFTLGDFAFAVLSNTLHRVTVAQQVSISYLNAPKGSRLLARASCRKNGRASVVIIVDITDDTGRDVAQFVGTGFKINPDPTGTRE